MKNYDYYESPFGLILIVTCDDFLVELKKVDEREFLSNENAISKKVKKELLEYFEGNRKSFDIPIKLSGTDFRMKVWNELLKIPYGNTISYKELARRVGNEKAVRAVGGANHNNPIWIIVPCHRVIGSNGSLTGYGGGIEMKKRLLELEGAL